MPTLAVVVCHCDQAYSKGMATGGKLSDICRMLGERSWVCLITSVTVFFSCSERQSSGLKEGLWRATLATPGGELPFSIDVVHDDSIIAYVINGDERIAITDIQQEGDSVFMRLPVFDSEIRAKVTGDTLEGNWIDHNRRTDTTKYQIPFRARYGLDYRFATTTGGEADEEHWEVTFSPDSSAESKAKGVFTIDGNHVEGTFLTETGDYRYLEGMIRNDSLLLSCFDGSHAYLFKARREGDTMNGMFWSGKHYSERWVAELNPDFELRDANSLTFLKPSYDRFEFSFPDTDNNMVSFDDFKGKVVIVQIMGSWCPNCMDESRFLSDAWRRYHADGLEIVGLSFEKTRDFNTARERVLRMKNNLNIPYQVLIAGYRDPKEVADKLPALNRLMSYPTSIFIDRNGEVIRIHTGFSGPATGKAFVEYQREFHELLPALL